MMKSQLLLAVVAIAAAPACATAKQKSANPSASAQKSSGGDLEIGAIDDAALPAGECGMILWTLESQRPAPIFRMTSGKDAEVVINGRKRKLQLVEASGASDFGVSEEQTLVGEGLTATVKMRFGLGFDGGTYLERGLLTVESADGWRAVVPAAGVAGCRGK